MTGILCLQVLVVLDAIGVSWPAAWVLSLGVLGIGVLDDGVVIWGPPGS